MLFYIEKQEKDSFVFMCYNKNVVNQSIQKNLHLEILITLELKKEAFDHVQIVQYKTLFYKKIKYEQVLFLPS